MALVAMVCPACGAKLEVEEGRDVFFCTYCGTRVEREIQRIHHTGSIEIESRTLENMLERAQTFIRLGDWYRAQLLYDEITDIYPQDYRGWWGEIVCETEGFEIFADREQTDMWFNNVERTAGDSQKIKMLKLNYEEYIASCDRHLEFEEKKASNRKAESNGITWIIIGGFLGLIGFGVLWDGGAVIASIVLLCIPAVAFIILGISMLKKSKRQ